MTERRQGKPGDYRGPTNQQLSAVAHESVVTPPARFRQRRQCGLRLDNAPMTTTETFVTGVDFVTVPAKDLAESEHFYGSVLGLPFVKQWGEMPAKEFQAGNLTLAVMDPTAFGQEFRPHGLPIAFQVDDVPAARERLEAQGVTFVTDIIDSGVCHQAIFLDPAGNSLNIHHRYAD
ncbi:MAG TPA: VOC family protein [Gaiellales bacterium]|nr:VOC family protein [Gaiellales bacterium]